MTSLVIVKADVIKHIRTRLLVAPVVGQINTFRLQRSEETLHRCIIPAVPGAGVAWHYSMPLQQCLVVKGTVLTTSVRMQNHLSRRLATCHSHRQGCMYQFLLHSVMHCPAHDSPGVQAQYHRQIQPPFASPDIGHIRHPALIDVTSSNVTQGASVVSEAEKNMHEIVTGSGNVSRLMDEISTSTAEQEKGIYQITLALSELERVTQSNVAMAEELNGSSDVLRNQVIELQTRTRNFRLEQGYSPSSLTGPAPFLQRPEHSL